MCVCVCVCVYNQCSKSNVSLCFYGNKNHYHDHINTIRER